MIYSMTGYGKSSGYYSGKNIVCEIKTLNAKFIDFVLRLDNLYKEKELGIRNLLSEQLVRGKVEVSIRTEGVTVEQASNIHEELFNRYYDQINSLAQKHGVENKSSFELALNMPDVIQKEEGELTDEEWKIVNQLVLDALNSVKEFRREEGKSLAKDLDQNVNRILSLLKSIEPFESDRIEEIKSRIKNQQEKFFESIQIDENRFEQELIYYLEKIDINEEKVRLQSHCDFFIKTLVDDASGKKLGFISQEIGREINTLGSKASNAKIQQIVVEMKEELEKIKEQVLNIV